MSNLRTPNAPVTPESAPTAYLLPTGRCNLTCPGCCATLEEFGRHSKRFEISTEQYRQVIRECIDLGIKVFDISGGEPFLRADLAAICEMIKSYEGTEIRLVNNGTLATRENLLVLASLVDLFIVSLDAADGNLHDEIRGMKGGFAKGIQTLRHAQNLGFPSIGINFLVMERNIDEVNEMLALAERERIDQLTFLTIRDVSENKETIAETPALEKLQGLWRETANFLSKSAWPASVHLVVPSFLYPEVSEFMKSIPSELQSRLILHMPNLFGKSAFRKLLVVKPFGTLTGDTSMVNDLIFDIGSAVTDLRTVWQTGSAEWRKKLKERETLLRSSDDGPCHKCSRWRYCRGGCAAAALRQWQDFQKYDRACDRFRVSANF